MRCILVVHGADGADQPASPAAETLMSNRDVVPSSVGWSIIVVYVCTYSMCAYSKLCFCYTTRG